MVGFHPVASPELMSIQAILLLDWPPILVNCPPTYNSFPLSAKVHTMLFGLGFQLVTFPVVMSNAANRFLIKPPILVYNPPANTEP